MQKSPVSYEEMSIFDAGDPTGHRLEYAVFQGEKLDIPPKKDNVVFMYVEVLKRLFVLYPEKLWGLQNSYLKLTDDPKKSVNLKDRQWKKISDAPCYLYTTTSSSEKFKQLRRVLDKLGLRDALRIKYQER